MKKTKRLAAALLAAVTTAALSACGAQTTTSRSGQGEVPGSETLKIAYIVMAKTDAFWTGMEAGAIKYADEVGVQVDFQAPEKETDVDKQVQFMENAITKGYDAIILSPADSIALAPVVKKANDAGIPVVLVNNTMEQSALDIAGAHVETYVGIEQYEAASLAGSYAAKTIPDGRICYLEGIPGVQALDDRLNGFRDQCGNFSVVASQTARCDRNEGFNVMQNVLSSNPEVNVVWAVNAEMGQGAIQAIEQSGFSGRVQVFDFDAAPDDLQAIKDGTLAGTVAQYPNLQAEAAIQACLDVLDGKELPAHTKTKASLVTAENVEAFEAGEDIG
ncbi:sugar ABC transporter substrate-binding protein [Butyricicoccus sp. 1XD8-22]|nr:sugar ABC transporter substrate-binding protein [Butyricicoccus sp. 1XD8-22]